MLIKSYSRFIGELNIERNVKMATTHFLNIQDYGMR